VDKLDELYGTLELDDIPADNFAPDVRVGVKVTVKPSTLESRDGQITSALSQKLQGSGDAEVSGDDAIYYVEKILRHRYKHGKTYFLVSWRGFGDSSWEPEENILDKGLIASYRHQNKMRGIRRRRRRARR